MSNPYDDPICSPKRERQEYRTLQRKRLKGLCVYCGSFKAITKDHVVPKSRGGKNVFENIQPLCKYCNQKKGSHTELELQMLYLDIKERGIWYDWEKPLAGWFDWLEYTCKEKKHICPIIHSGKVSHLC